MILASWGGKQLEVSARVIEGISKLGYYIEAETEDKDSNKSGYKKFKSAKRSLDMDVILRADLNVDVRAEINAWMDLCAAGKTDKFYVAGQAISECVYLLTSAKADEVQIAPDGTWKSAEMRLEFAQSGAGGSSGSSKSSGSKKASVKSKTTSGGSSSRKDSPYYNLVGKLADEKRAKEAERIHRQAIAANVKKAAQEKLRAAKGKPTGGGGGVKYVTRY